jgi:carbonic anhydrase
MERRGFIKGLAVIGLCPLCAKPSFAAQGPHWSYEGEHGPDHWGALGADDAACSVGSQQSPLDITGAIEAEVPAIILDWKKGQGEIVNNGHTIQVNMPAGGKLSRGDKSYDLLQFHFHTPSEHLVQDKSFAMEVHFVNKNAEIRITGCARRVHDTGSDERGLRRPCRRLSYRGRCQGAGRGRSEWPAAERLQHVANVA